jgi:hypothetical protein
MSKEGALMYWGDEYQRPITFIQQRRAVQFNSHLIASREERATSYSGKETPVLEFRVIAGAPLRSRCQWARLVFHGKGPIKRILQQRNLFSSFSPFDTSFRYYLSLDEFGLHFFENKYDNKASFVLSISDVKGIEVDVNGPTALQSSKSVVEDIFIVKVSSYSGDEIYMR